MKIVLAIGCFDVLHSGHIQHLLEAKSMGDRLIVGLTIDEFVNKGPYRPVNSWEDRAFFLREIRCVDEVIQNKEGFDTIKHIKPDIFVKGLDQLNHGSEILKVCREYNVRIRFTSLRLGKDGKKLSTSNFIERVKCAS